LLDAQLQSLNLTTMQLQASVSLVRSLGGGWEDPGEDALYANQTKPKGT
jgi:outer membrane protein TolC